MLSGISYWANARSREIMPQAVCQLSAPTCACVVNNRPVRRRISPHPSTRQYSRIVASWVGSIGLDPAAYGTHSLRRTKATLIYRRTRTLRAVQLLLGHTKLESTVRYLGIEVDDALEIAEQTEV